MIIKCRDFSFSNPIFLLRTELCLFLQKMEENRRFCRSHFPKDRIVLYRIWQMPVKNDDRSNARGEYQSPIDDEYE